MRPTRRCLSSKRLRLEEMSEGVEEMSLACLRWLREQTSSRRTSQEGEDPESASEWTKLFWEALESSAEFLEVPSYPVYFFLLVVGKTSHAFTFHKRRALVGYSMKHTRRVADQSHRFAGIVEALDQRDGIGAFSEIPHGSVSAHIEHCVKILCFHISKSDCLREGALCRKSPEL